jgi:hypothetical protein
MTAFLRTCSRLIAVVAAIMLAAAPLMAGSVDRPRVAASEEESAPPGEETEDSLPDDALPRNLPDASQLRREPTATSLSHIPRLHSSRRSLTSIRRPVTAAMNPPLRC